jgi:hypothetical protein
MARAIKNITVSWTWDGDKDLLQGFNIALCPSGKNPKEETVAKAYAPMSYNASGTTYSYVLKNVVLDLSSTYAVYVQSVYPDVDSDWVSASAGTVTDNGLATLGIGSYVGSAAPSGSSFDVGTTFYRNTDNSVWVWNGSQWWSAADKTETTINNGFITTGILEVGSGSYGTGNAGICGNSGTNPVRFWAGKSFANRDTAPFRVLNDGTMYATNATIGGGIDASGLTISYQGHIKSGKTSATSTVNGFYLGSDGLQLTVKKLDLATLVYASPNYVGDVMEAFLGVGSHQLPVSTTYPAGKVVSLTDSDTGSFALVYTVANWTVGAAGTLISSVQQVINAFLGVSSSPLKLLDSTGWALITTTPFSPIGAYLGTGGAGSVISTGSKIGITADDSGGNFSGAAYNKKSSFLLEVTSGSYTAPNPFTIADVQKWINIGIMSQSYANNDVFQTNIPMFSIGDTSVGQSMTFSPRDGLRVKGDM